MSTEPTNHYRKQLELDIVKAAKDAGEKPPRPAVKPLLLTVGDTIRANGYLYKVRKVTLKDYVLRLIGVENRPAVEVKRG